MINKNLLVLALSSLVSIGFAQEQPVDNQTTTNQTEVILDMNPSQMAAAKSPLLTGPKCEYHWYPEFNVLHTMCFDAYGLPANQQYRVVSQPIQNCQVLNNDYIMALKIQNIARFMVKPTDGSYFCCDVYEPGYGYLFTDCGGSEMIVLNDRYQNDQQYRDLNKVTGFTNPLWNYTQLGVLIDAKCNNTYKVGDEYQWGGEYQVWMTMNLPWQQWMVDMNIRDLEELRTWLIRYYDFMQVLFINFTESNDTTRAAQAETLINALNSSNMTNMTAEQLIQIFTPFLGNFSEWYSTLKTQVVQSQPGLNAIPPGYRAIVRWVRSRMIQELHYRIAQQVIANNQSSSIILPPPVGVDNGAGGIGVDFGSQTYHGSFNLPALTGGGATLNNQWFASINGV